MAKEDDVTRISILATLLAAFALLLCPLEAVAGAQPGAKAYRLTLERGSRLSVNAKINGHPASALLDSAAELTLLDKVWAHALTLDQGKAVAGQGSGSASFEAQLVDGVTLEALGLRLPGQTVAIADLSDVGRRLLHRRLDAILGREVFDAARLSIDIEGRRIAVIDRNSEPHGQRLGLVTEHGIETVPVRIESDEPVRATFDLGNGSQVLVGAALAQRMGLLVDGRKVSEQAGGGLGGEARRQVFRLRTLEVAGQVLSNVEAAIDPNPSASDVNIGVSVLRHFRITTDYSRHVVWLEPRR
jgi:predicted aspartyl protease